MTTKGYTVDTLKITKTFLWDHESRRLPMPNIVKETKQYAWIEIDFTHVGYIDLMEDAEYYGWEMPLGGFEDSGTIRAAQNLYHKMEETKSHESWERRTGGDWFRKTFNFYIYRK